MDRRRPGGREAGNRRPAADTTAHRSPGSPAPPAAGAPVTTGYNDLDLQRWKEYPEIETGSLWLFGARDRSGGHRLDYHGNFIPQIATQTFHRFSRKGEVVLDLFLGLGHLGAGGGPSGPALPRGRACRRSWRSGCGRSSPEAGGAGAGSHHRGRQRRVRKPLARVRDQLAAWGEAWRAPAGAPPRPTTTSFPSATVRKTFATRPPWPTSWPGSRRWPARQRDLLDPGRFAALVIGDAYARGELVPLGFRCMEAMNQAGFRTRSIVVKNIEGNERGKGRDNNLWRYRALRGGFYLFKHEYVIIFQK